LETLHREAQSSLEGFACKRISALSCSPDVD
jgi:hypothetical protein